MTDEGTHYYGDNCNPPHIPPLPPPDGPDYQYTILANGKAVRLPEPGSDSYPSVADEAAAQRLADELAPFFEPSVTDDRVSPEQRRMLDAFRAEKADRYPSVTDEPCPTCDDGGYQRWRVDHGLSAWTCPNCKRSDPLVTDEP